ncbi:hypothetical protein I5677_00200 [Mobilitalea sibirica]|uniref:YTH domain-containing protein n=1 Tax=Mobilitalea sibirica TaxID=1462919 RepID=A0A8J7KRH9_9FIRM|nr:hypothetical protein [Mobilitalea sibirica]MBH1939306.1 hypothetical protein [Mobilitalea sibirica]
MPFLKHDRRPVIRHPHGHPVAVIAAFNVLGDFIPRYFCIEDDNQELFKYKIHSVISTKDRYMLKEFYCVYDTYDYRTNILLIFDITKCRWTIG